MRRQYDWIAALLICAVLHFLQLMQVQLHTHVIFKLFPSSHLVYYNYSPLHKML